MHVMSSTKSSCVRLKPSGNNGASPRLAEVITLLCALSHKAFQARSSRVLSDWIRDYSITIHARLLKRGVYNLPTITADDEMELSSLRRERITRILQRQAGNTENIVAASLLIWEQISLPLARMIGRLGVASLFERCISVQAMDKPWLPHGNKAVLDDSLYTTVWESVRQQPPEVALSTTIDIFSCFFELLSMMIGDRLTMRVFLTGIPDDTDENKDQEVQ